VANAVTLLQGYTGVLQTDGSHSWERVDGCANPERAWRDYRLAALRSRRLR
jgi:hypothetical protein